MCITIKFTSAFVNLSKRFIAYGKADWKGCQDLHRQLLVVLKYVLVLPYWSNGLLYSWCRFALTFLCALQVLSTGLFVIFFSPFPQLQLGHGEENG
jgi:hypothetical protein